MNYVGKPTKHLKQTYVCYELTSTQAITSKLYINNVWHKSDLILDKRIGQFGQS